MHTIPRLHHLAWIEPRVMLHTISTPLWDMRSRPLLKHKTPQLRHKATLPANYVNVRRHYQCVETNEHWLPQKSLKEQLNYVEPTPTQYFFGRECMIVIQRQVRHWSSFLQHHVQRICDNIKYHCKHETPYEDLLAATTLKITYLFSEPDFYAIVLNGWNSEFDD